MQKPATVKPNNILLVVSIVLAGLLFRRPDTFFMPQLYAEDGKVFLQQFESLGIASLFKPYAGYLHTIPRLVAAFWGMPGIDYEYIPLCYNLSTLLITCGAAVYLHRCAVRLQIPYAVAFATVFVFIPINSELYMNLTNTIWITSLALVGYLLLLQKDIAVSKDSIGVTNVLGWFVVGVFALTGPVSLLMAPMVLLMLVQKRKQLSFAKAVPLLIVLLAGLVQFICIKFIDPNVSRTDATSPQSGHLLSFFTSNIKGLFFLNAEVLKETPADTIQSISIAILTGFTLLLGWLYYKSRFSGKHILIWGGAIYLIAFIVAYWPNEADVLALRSARYYFMPFSCLMMFVIATFDARMKGSYVGLYLCYLLLHADDIKSSLENKIWVIKVREYKMGLTDEIDINPNGWTVKLPHKYDLYTKLDNLSFDSYKKDSSLMIYMWSSNFITSVPITLPKGDYHIALSGNGNPAGNVFPHINISINNNRVGDFFLTPFPVCNPVFSFHQSENKPIVIKLQMENDTAIGNEDRNGFINHVLISRRKD